MALDLNGGLVSFCHRRFLQANQMKKPPEGGFSVSWWWRKAAIKTTPSTPCAYVRKTADCMGCLEFLQDQL
jgi:hypothetical protein